MHTLSLSERPVVYSIPNFYFCFSFSLSSTDLILRNNYFVSSRAPRYSRSEFQNLFFNVTMKVILTVITVKDLDDMDFTV